MYKLFVASLSLALLITAGSTFARPGGAEATSSSQQMLIADLTGAAEVPGPGDAAGTGTAMVTLNTADNTICVESSYANIALPITGAHIHEGAEGASGPVVVGFIGGGGPIQPTSEMSISGCTAVEASRLQSISDNPGNFYFNIHNGDFGAGAIRGQLAK